ncbi:MAG: sensor histidine kinase [Roseburia sp.]
MVVVCILLTILCIFLLIRFFSLKIGILRLEESFRAACGNRQGEQHICCSVPDKHLEKLAAECNRYISEFYRERYQHANEVTTIRREITNLSHDLRTPITSIIGYVDLMAEEGMTQEQTENLAVVKRRAEDLNELIEQLYDYVRLENMELKPQKKRLDLFRIFREHLLRFYDEFEKKGIALQLEFPKEEAPIWIDGDPVFLERVFSNLTSNTIKYCGGRASISLRREQEDSRAVITYRSPRGGLSDYDIHHLFDRYYQKDQSRSNSRSSGLGLTIAKLYVEQMGGRISAWGDVEELYIEIAFAGAEPERLLHLREKRY